MFPFRDVLGLLFPGNVPGMICFSKPSPLLRITRRRVLESQGIKTRLRALPIIGAARRWYRSTRVL